MIPFKNFWYTGGDHGEFDGDKCRFLALSRAVEKSQAVFVGLYKIGTLNMQEFSSKPIHGTYGRVTGAKDAKFFGGANEKL